MEEIYHGYYYSRYVVSGIVMVLIGLILMVLSWYSFKWSASSVKTYTESTPILDRKVNIKRLGMGKFLVEMEYSYITVADGVETVRTGYTDTVTLNSFNQAAQKKSELDGLKTVYYAPNNPKDSIVILPSGSYIPAAIGLVLIAAGIGSFMLRNNKTAHAYSAGSDAMSLMRGFVSPSEKLNYDWSSEVSSLNM